MKKITCTFVSLSILLSIVFSEKAIAQTILVSENFENYLGTAGSVPAGWTFSFNGRYNSSFANSNCGPDSSAYQFGGTAPAFPTITTPAFANADSVSFWIKATTQIDTNSFLAVLKTSDGITWDTLTKLIPLPTTGTVHTLAVSDTTVRLRFTFAKLVSGGNLAFDCFSVTRNIYTPVALFGASNACLGDSICFTDSSLIGGSNTITSWHWNFGDNDTSSLQNPCHTYQAANNYTVELIVTGSNSLTDTITQVVTVSSLPQALFSYVNVSGSTIEFTNSSTSDSGNIVSYLWDFGDFSQGSTDSLPQPHNYSGLGKFNVCLQVTSAEGCKNLFCDSINVIGVGIKNTLEAKNEITIGPNPAKNEITIHTANLKSPLLSAEMYDMIGNKFILTERNISGNNYIFNLPTVASGFYFVKIIADNTPLVMRISVVN